VAQEEFRVKGNSSRKLWPLEKECPACRDSSGDVDLGWDDDAVYFYLSDFYTPVPRRGHSEVVTVEKPVGVPYWAALSIAIASCGFTFATLYMRAYTLKLKYLLCSPLSHPSSVSSLFRLQNMISVGRAICCFRVDYIPVSKIWKYHACGASCCEHYENSFKHSSCPSVDQSQFLWLTLIFFFPFLRFQVFPTTIQVVIGDLHPARVYVMDVRIGPSFTADRSLSPSWNFY
jgi:hypothetical protein